MKFLIKEDAERVTDSEINRLLTNAYVGGGFTSAERAATIFVPASVRIRGKMVVARTAEGVFAGMVIVVRPDSPAQRMAEPDEAEIQLLAVDSIFRGQGLGRMLMSTALEIIREMGFEKSVLWTQPAMLPAHRLYESLGFVRVPSRDPVLDGILFFAYEKRQLGRIGGRTSCPH